MPPSPVLLFEVVAVVADVLLEAHRRDAGPLGKQIERDTGVLGDGGDGLVEGGDQLLGGGGHGCGVVWFEGGQDSVV